MCLAVPSEIVEIRDRVATIDAGGVRRQVSLILLPEEPSVGDYVLVHAGFAIHHMGREAAEEAFALIGEIEGEIEQEGNSKRQNPNAKPISTEPRAK